MSNQGQTITCQSHLACGPTVLGATNPQIQKYRQKCFTEIAAVEIETTSQRRLEILKSVYMAAMDLIAHNAQREIVSFDKRSYSATGL